MHVLRRSIEPTPFLSFDTKQSEAVNVKVSAGPNDFSNARF